MNSPVPESMPGEVKIPDVEELDAIWKPLGGFGKFQFLNIVCCALILLQFTVSDIGYAITAAELKHRCLITECEGEESSYGAEGATWLPAAIPTTSTGTYDSCRRYNASSHGDSNASSLLCTNSSFSTQPYQCHSFIYETDEWTIHREDWDLHCPEDRTWLHFVGTLDILGHISGTIYQGYLIDKFGRKAILMTFTLLVTVLGTIKSFSTSFFMFAALEVIEGQAAANLYYGPFVLALESVAPGQRALVGLVMESMSTTGEVFVAVVQYLTFNWRTTILICYLPFLISISYFWLLPESIRWLITKQRYDDATTVFKKIAKMNGAEYPEKAVDSLISAESSRCLKGKSGKSWKEQLKSIWKSKILRRRFFGNLVMRMATNFVYYGMTLESVALSDDKFLNFSLSGLAELPGYVIAYFLMDRIGRKRSLWIFTLFSGVACVTSGLVPAADLRTVKLVIFLFGKLSISGAMSCLDVLTTEMYPTLIRSTVVSTNIFVGKIITLVLPLVPLLSDFFPPLPLLLFGVASLIGLCTAIVFPETLDSRLPDTIEEAEELSTRVHVSIIPDKWNPKNWFGTLHPYRIS